MNILFARIDKDRLTLARIAFIVLTLACSTVDAQDVQVKYIGMVDLSSYQCRSITRSSFIRHLCYDRASKKVVVQLNATRYQYCDVDRNTIREWLSASSMGQYYNHSIKRVKACNNQ